MAGRTSRIDPETVSRFAEVLALKDDPASVRRRVEALEHLMEGLVTLPGINRKIGLDVILDLVPIAGDAVAAAMGAYMIWEARNLGMSRWQMTRMATNVGIDFGLGLIPFVGAIPDFFFRSNTRNLKIIKRHLDKHHPSSVLIDAKPRAKS
ncbi:MAG: DUF4112 domain-containing protein [Sphingomonas sp.]|uniref:DUF4112 domain-containing protein n=1 Tax=Sphingomonas sp. TaxID=28214 RepID=UPI0025D06A4D|nr:DUF4112 domain-containing protein [Sphingomonas sp.]MBY0282767.1 DUF4112 domain-containing protein [Sphingomonas sp.]